MSRYSHILAKKPPGPKIPTLLPLPRGMSVREVGRERVRVGIPIHCSHWELGFQKVRDQNK